MHFVAYRPARRSQLIPQLRQGSADQTFDSDQLLRSQLLLPAGDGIEISRLGRERSVWPSHGAKRRSPNAIVVEVMIKESAQPPQHRARITNQLLESDLRIVIPEQRTSGPPFLHNPFPVQRRTFGSLAIFPREGADIPFLG